MAYEIIWEEKGVIFIYSKDITDDDFINSNMEIYKHPKFETIEYEILDLLNVKNFTVSSQSIQRIAKMDAKVYNLNSNIKVAIVANKLIVKGLTNIYKVYFQMAGGGSTWDTNIFESVEDARKWLKA